MTERIKQNDFMRRLAANMKTDEVTAAQWTDGFIKTLYEAIKAGESVNFTGFGSFYVRPESKNWAFKFNPAQKLRAVFGWSSTYKGDL